MIKPTKMVLGKSLSIKRNELSNIRGAAPATTPFKY